MKIYLLTTLFFVYAANSYSCQKALHYIHECNADAFLRAFNNIPENQRTPDFYTQLLWASKESWRQSATNANYAHVKFHEQKQDHAYGTAFFAAIFGSGITGLFGWLGYKSYLAALNVIKSQKLNLLNVRTVSFAATTFACTTASLITLYQTILAVPYAYNYKDNLKKESEKRSNKFQSSDKIHTLLDDTLNPSETRKNWLANQPIFYPIPLENLPEYNNFSNNASDLRESNAQKNDESKVISNPIITSCPSHLDPQTGQNK